MHTDENTTLPTHLLVEATVAVVVIVQQSRRRRSPNHLASALSPDQVCHFGVNQVALAGPAGKRLVQL